MKPWVAVAVTAGMLIVTLFVSAVVRFDLTWVMIPGTALWAAVDSSKLQLKRYVSGISYGPVVLFIGITMLWIVGFPWYLVVRHKIRTGVAVLKDPKVGNAI